jgi:hypothetical protein
LFALSRHFVICVCNIHFISEEIWTVGLFVCS